MIKVNTLVRVFTVYRSIRPKNYNIIFIQRSSKSN